MADAGGPRVALFHPYPGRMGGSQQVTLALARHLPASGYRPVVVVPGDGAFADAARAAGLEVATCDPGPRWRVQGTEARSGAWLSPAALVQLVRYWRALARVLRERELALVHGIDVRGALMAAPAARLAGLPSLWHVHSAPRGAAMRTVGLAIAASARNMLYVSQGAADAWRFPPRLLGVTAVVPNGQDQIAAGAEAREVEPATILVAASLSASKGQDVMVRAMPSVIQRFPGARCLLAGGDWADGQFSRGLRELIAGLGLQESVSLLGHRQDVPALIARCACVVVPSRSETFGMVAVEAMALARPVVASRVGGLPEVVEDGATGLLVAPEDPEALASALIALLADRDRARRMGQRGRERWTQLFKASAMAERTARFYDRVLARPDPH